MDLASNLRFENETIDSDQEKKYLSSKQLNFMKNAWRKMDQNMQRTLKRIAHQNLKSEQEIKDFDLFLDNLDGESSTQDIPFKNEQGECIIPWAILDVFVWTLALLTFGICSIS
jgi:predicted N-acyltransferase